jgi:hypothetical protein
VSRAVAASFVLGGLALIAVCVVGIVDTFAFGHDSVWVAIYGTAARVVLAYIGFRLVRFGIDQWRDPV